MSERVAEYIREVIEEGLNLDVSGDPLLERLSMQCPPSRFLPGVTSLVHQLGLSRITVCGINSSISSNSGGSPGENIYLSDAENTQLLLVTTLDDAEVGDTIAHYLKK